MFFKYNFYRWRFESLKSRCILLDREHLLVENKITFKPVHAIEFQISEKEQKEARPRIVSKRRSSTFDNIVARRSMTPIKEVKSKIDTSTSQLSITAKTALTDSLKEWSETTDNSEKVELEKEIPNTVLQELCENTKDLNIIKECSTIPQTTENDDKIIITEDTSIALEKSKNLSDPIGTEDKENCNNTVVSPLPDSFAKLKAKPPSPMRPSQRSTKKTPPARSILTKKREIITAEPSKNVKFSSKADTVHNISPDTPSTSRNKTPIKDANSNLTKKTTNNKTVVKQGRTKSNIVVRHVVVSSKHD